MLAPWRRDPHPDHRAAWQPIARALGSGPYPTHGRGRGVRLIEYLIWSWELAASGDAPRSGEVVPWRLDISAVLPRKLSAIAAHRS